MNTFQKKINILQVMPEFGLAGAETMCECLINELIATGNYNVIVASLYDYHSPITDRLEENGVKIIYLGKKNGADLGVTHKLFRIIKEYKIDILHTHRYVMQYAVPAAIFAKVPVRVHTVHNIAQKEVDWFRRKLAWLFYRLCHVVPVSISPIVSDTIASEYGIKKNSVHMVYNGSNLNNCIVKKNYKQVDNVFRFIHIGRFNVQKNHAIIIEAIKNLKQQGRRVHIDLIGAGELLTTIKDLVNQYGLKDEVTFCGLQSNIYPFLVKSDVFILPSMYEGMPITLIEALGCGMPIIASSVGGIPDMIDDRCNGILIRPAIEDLTSAMTQLMDDNVLRERIGVNALAKSHDFSAEKMRDGYIEIYEQELKKYKK